MTLEAFAPSQPLTLGVELELAIVNTHDYDLSPSSADLLRLMGKRKIPGDVKPEMTDSMIELSTGICTGYDDALSQLTEIRDALVDCARKLNVGLCGGGTHPFQDWSERRIFNTPRFHMLSELYGYLSKQFTIFGQHVHVGCPGPDEALVLLHGLSRFIPHFIALSASSPYVQGTDTGFHSARLNSVFAFPLSGRAPFVTTWDDFGTFFGKMTRTGVVQSMKDFYWDIRPKPEFGTIEVRVLDTPLTIEKAAALAAYIQCVAAWLSKEQPFPLEEDDYLVYTFNRFQACRFGPEGTFVDPKTGEHRSLREDILFTMGAIEHHAIELKADGALRYLRSELQRHGNDATWARQVHEREHLLAEVVRQQCLRWSGDLVV
ncbi:YbdK family carboxylate-amine ligase [Caldimonas thermodepolymerans]|uniref:YbdK family carboxylate-amine ligase n=1 Tax=Caldimonas thermodepolymerans TaxID=215580 RepID=UPI0022362694|nr:YbdK family carboxylate-amine ligase [Caldimonas thermodepolymerans]UZG43886.1 YbdK family carboxylate-amine ligase [Caldimonas thermodepolymerans]